MTGLVSGFVLAVLLAPWQSINAEDEVPDVDNWQNPDSVELSVDQVPQVVVSAAFEARPGMYVTRVVRDLEADDDYYYSFEDSRPGSVWTVLVRADGRVMKVREEDDRPQRGRD